VISVTQIKWCLENKASGKIKKVRGGGILFYNMKMLMLYWFAVVLKFDVNHLNALCVAETILLSYVYE
jgi:hypothetical protein